MNEIVYLEDICKIQGRVGWKGYTVEDLTDKGPWVIGANDITNYHQLDLSKAKHITREKFEESPEIKIEINDILIVKVGNTIGKVAIIKDDIGEACINPNTVLLKKCKIDPYYLYLVLISPYGQSFLKNNSSASAQPALNQTTLKKMQIYLPSSDEQKRVGNLVRFVNNKIELNHKINAELEAMAKTLYDYWFVQFDFPMTKEQADEIGKPAAAGKPYKSSGGKMVYNKELKREIPEGWEVYNLDEFGSFKNGINYDPSDPGNTNAQIINVRDISSSSIFISTNELEEIQLKEKEVKKYLVSENSIIIARSGIPGATRLINDYKENTIFCGFIICLNVEDINLKNILFFYLKLIERAMTNQSAGTIMKNVSQGTLKEIKIALPKDFKNNIINKLMLFINPIFQKISLVNKENQQLTELRDWLLPMLMNGQVTLRQAQGKPEKLDMAAEPNSKYKSS